MESKVKRITKAGVVAAVYVALALPLLGVASSAWQIRLSEGLTLLPLLFPETCASLFFGCFLVNLLSGASALDVALGSLITLLSAFLTAVIGKRVKRDGLQILFGGLFPVALNALLLPLIWCVVAKSFALYGAWAASVALTEGVAVYGLGTLVHFSAKRLDALPKNKE